MAFVVTNNAFKQLETQLNIKKTSKVDVIRIQIKSNKVFFIIDQEIVGDQIERNQYGKAILSIDAKTRLVLKPFSLDYTTEKGFFVRTPF